MSKCWNHWIAAACCAGLFLAAGCSKPAPEPAPAGDPGTTAESTAADPDSNKPVRSASRTPSIEFEHLFQVGTGVMNQKAYLFKLAVRVGQLTEVDLTEATPKMHQWLSDRGIPTTTLQVAKD